MKLFHEAGIDDISISELEWFELRVIQNALSDYFQTQMKTDGFITAEGEVALGMMAKIQDFRGEAFKNKE